MVRVAINGFGRIGRMAFRQMFDMKGYKIVAINDLTDPKMLAHLLKYDSTQKRYAHRNNIVAGEDYIEVEGKKIPIFKEADASKLPWKKLKIDVVLECTGFYTSKAPRDPEAHRSGHFCRFLHHQLPGSHDQGPERSRSHSERYHVHGSRLHRRPDAA